jgi:hypothetical protein
MVDTVGASRFNSEGWTTAYGGTGITVWAECSWKRREVQQVTEGFNSVTLL